MRKAILGVVLLLAACNTDSDLRRWYVQSDPTPRPSRPAAQVQILEVPPADRPFKIIGIFSPPDNAFESYGEALKGAQRAGALYGADAVLVTSHGTTPQLRRSVLESASLVHIEAQAIVFGAP